MKKGIGFVILFCLALSVFFFGKIFFFQSKSSTLTSVATNQRMEKDSEKEITPGIPIRIEIPSLNITTTVESVGQDSEGKMDVPRRIENSAWYKLGYRPGHVGNAVIAAHFDDPQGNPAVFYRLSELKVGDEVKVLDDKNTTFIYIVTASERYPNDNFPLVDVFGDSTKSRLNLITCDGVFNKAKNTYSDRLVVYSELKN